MKAVIDVVGEVIIAVQITAEDRRVVRHIPQVGIGLADTGVATLDRHAGNKLKGRGMVPAACHVSSDSVADPCPVRHVGALGYADRVVDAGLREGVLWMGERRGPGQSVAQSGCVGVDIQGLTPAVDLEFVYAKGDARGDDTNPQRPRPDRLTILGKTKLMTTPKHEATALGGTRIHEATD